MIISIQIPENVYTDLLVLYMHYIENFDVFIDIKFVYQHIRKLI